MENKIEKTPANNYDNNIFDKKEKNSICISTEDNIKGSFQLKEIVVFLNLVFHVCIYFIA